MSFILLRFARPQCLSAIHLASPEVGDGLNWPKPQCTYNAIVTSQAQHANEGVLRSYLVCSMSAAFDTLDHNTLLHRLQHTFGLSGYAISWICSYLTDRSSFVKINSSSSPSTTILTGVPQGSVLGPLFFVLFISPIAKFHKF